jgi:hypothetical protein
MKLFGTADTSVMFTIYKLLFLFTSLRALLPLIRQSDGNHQLLPDCGRKEQMTQEISKCSSPLSCKQGPTKGGGGLPGCSPLPKPPTPKFKNPDFVDIMISNVQRDFPFSRNQQLKSADD